jgi:hypothetical protein
VHAKTAKDAKELNPNELDGVELQDLREISVHRKIVGRPTFDSIEECTLTVG